MRDDDEVIAAYERQLDEAVGDAGDVGTQEPRAGRGFWIVAGALVFGCIVLVAQILANRPIAETIAHAQHSLRVAAGGARGVLRDTGSFTGAGSEQLATAVPSLTFRDADDPSTGLDDVSVSSSEDVWAAAVRAGSDACFYLRLERRADPRYGVGGGCTGDAARRASDPRW